MHYVTRAFFIIKCAFWVIQDTDLNIEKPSLFRTFTKKIDMKRFAFFPFLTPVWIAFLLFFALGCEKEEDENTSPGHPSSTGSATANVPTLSTNAITGIYWNAATTGGVIEYTGGSIEERGVCWYTSPDPTISHQKLVSTSSNSTFTSIISGLSPQTTYYVRAYATNHLGTGYGENFAFTTPAKEVFTDESGNTYTAIKIGTQIWMTENLKTTKLNDGTNIKELLTNTSWDTTQTPGYTWYNNDYATYGTTYGALYNYFAVTTLQLCPTGWHVGTYSEWEELMDYIGGDEVSGTMLKEAGTTHWSDPNTGIDSFGFKALPGGYRSYIDFYHVRDNGYWWAGPELSNNHYRYMLHYSPRSYSGAITAYTGMSVRCLKDE